jgi:hypothetical protein
MARYNVKLMFMETYDFDDIEATSESDAEEKALDMLSGAYSSDSAYWDREVELIEEDEE